MNVKNPLAHNGDVARAYADLLNSFYGDKTLSSFSPSNFKKVIGRYGPNFSGYGQQDSQEFLLFLLDGLQEDLNRILKKPYIEKPDSTDEMVYDEVALKGLADKSWDIYKARNDSIITDLFAGMYKSTVTCPVCDKVSIIFDPFNNLTLQLPIENNWSKEIYYLGIAKHPIRIDVDIDKYATFKTLKEYCAKRMKSDPTKLIAAEVYKTKFYKVFDNVTTIAEAGIQAADDIWIFEVDSLPTNYNPNRAKKYMTFSRLDDEEIPCEDSAEADTLLIPVFHRLVTPSGGRAAPSRKFFGVPFYITLSRDDRSDSEEVLRKLVGQVSGLTTKNILEDDASFDLSAPTSEASDTVLMNEDDVNSDSNQAQATSIEGEDGLVDVSMKDTSSPPPLVPSAKTRHPGRKILDKGTFIPRGLANMFDVRIFTPTASREAVPTGWQQLQEEKEYIGLDDRALQQRHGASRNGVRSSPMSLDDLNNSSPESVPATESEMDSGTDIPQINTSTPSDEDSEELPAFSRNTTQRTRQKTYSRKERSTTKKSDRISGKKQSLINPGEGIILDWRPGPFEALFEGAPNDDGDFRAAPAWKNPELYDDEELTAKRSKRQSRRRNGISLEDCLNEFGKSETLSEANAWYCPRCKEHRLADKKFELWKVPDILVMHLKRFSSNRNFRDKLEILVDFPTEGLDLTDRVLTKDDDRSLVYDLIAVDNHYGGLGGGHYTAYAQSYYDKGWYEYNGNS